MSATRSASSTSTPLAERQRFTKFYAEDIPAAGPRLRSRSTPQLAARLRKAGLAHTYQVLQGSGAAASAAATVADTKFRNPGRHLDGHMVRPRRSGYLQVRRHHPTADVSGQEHVRRRKATEEGDAGCWSATILTAITLLPSAGSFAASSYSYYTLELHP